MQDWKNKPKRKIKTNTMKSFYYLFLSLSVSALTVRAQDTFSIVAADSTTREVGSAGASCVNLFTFNITDHGFIGDLISNVGAINTQAHYLSGNQSNARTRMLAGDSPEQIIAWLNANDMGFDSTVRQYGIVRFTENNVSAVGYTGFNCMDYKNHVTGNIDGIYYSIQGNILLGQNILDSMELNFRNAKGDLACRLMAAMQGANVVGADTRCASNNSSSLFAYVKVAQFDDNDGSPSFNVGLRTQSGAQIEPIDSLQKLFNMKRGCYGTSINETSFNKYLKIYPNPTTGKIVIALAEYNTEIQQSEFSIFNLYGTNIFNTILTSGKTEIDLSDFEKGFYFFEIKFKDSVSKKGKLILE